MLTVTVDGHENFNESEQTFEDVDSVTFELEHSLLSLSKWESKYQKPFLSTGEKTSEEIFGYLICMVTTSSGDLDALNRCSQTELNRIQAYIDSKESATTFGEMPQRRGPGEVITSELIYYWLVAFNIPFEVETWHLNRLFSLIRICNIKQQKPKKLSRGEIARRNHDLNRQRREATGTTG